jgi:2-methylcitrate dehydratase PrpD
MKNYFAIGQEDPMATYCRMIVETHYEELPPKVIKFAKHMILDTIGSMMGGSKIVGIKPVVDHVKRKGGRAECYIPFYGGKVPASEAGMALAPMSRAMEFAAIHPDAMHSAEHSLPATLVASSLAKKPTGKDFITAFVLGTEILLRIGTAFRGNVGVSMGRSNGHYIFGSVACAGKMMGLTLEELQNAEGISRSMTQPHDMAAFHPVTDMVNVHQGFICQDAINCCLLAKRGITGPHHDVILGQRGYLGFAKWETDNDALMRGLGEEWELLRNMVKPYTGCLCLFTAMDAALKLMAEHRFSPEDIARLEVDESTLNWAVLDGPDEVKKNPQNATDCQFSIPYMVATVLYDHDAMPDAYTPKARERKHIRALMAKISSKEDPSLPMWAARVTITLKNGQKYTKQFLAEELKGHPQNPFTEEEMAERFRKCVPYSAYKPINKVINTYIDSVFNLEKVDNVVKALILPLTPKK